MEYADRVLTQILNAKPSAKLDIQRIQNPSVYINTVKQLMHDGFLTMQQVEFSDDYHFLKILDTEILNFKKHKQNTLRLWKLYQKLKNSHNAPIVEQAAKLPYQTDGAPLINRTKENVKPATEAVLYGKQLLLQ